MSKLITRIKRLALALCLATPVVSWANTDLQVTVTDNTVVIDNDNAEAFDHMTFYVNSPVVTIPASETLPLGTQIELTSISFGKRASGSGNTRPNTLSITGTDGTVYTSEAIVESGTFTNAGCTKEVYSFADKGCVLTVGLSYAMSFKNSDGSDFVTLVSRTAKNSASLFGTTVYNSNYTIWLPVQELTGEIVGSTDFTLVTGATTDIKNTDTTKPTYLHNATGWISTDTASSGEIKLVNGPAGYALSVNNANSLADGNPNRVSVWKKLSGDGTLTTSGANNVAPVIEVFDSSEFTGTITSSGTPKLSVIFCNEGETLTDEDHTTLYSLINWQRLIYVSAGRTAANNAVVTVPAGKTWTAANGLKNYGETVVDGTFAGPIVNEGKLTINGSITGTVSGSGTVVVNEGATLPSFGSQRDFTGFTVDSSVPVKITMSSEEYGKGSVSVTGANGIASITVLAPDGTTTVGTITPAESSTLETGVKTSGLATWCDYEFNGDKSNSGVNKTGLTSDVDTNEYPEIFNNQMLYTYTHPYRGVTYPNSWTAVVRCTVPELENAIVVMFGTYSAGAIGLAAGPNPEEQMLLVSTPGAVEQAEDKHFTTLATMNVKDATTAQHVYVFTKDGTTVNVYCDGEKVLENYELASATLGGGLQIGSLHGGVVQSGVHTGLVRFGAGESQISSLSVAQQQNARIDCMRMYDYIVSPEQIAALSVEFPAVKLYRATVAEDADTSWTDLTWAPAWDGGNTQSKVILTTEGDATVALPDSITVDEVQLDLAEGSTLTLTGPGALAITQPITIEDGTLELTGTVTLTRNTAFNGTVKFTQFTKAGDGAIQLSNGATVGVDAALVVTPLGNYTCAEGTVVDSAYTGDGVVKLIPLTSAVVSITQSGTTLYYSDLDTAVTTLMTIGNVSDDVSCVLLNGTTWPTTPQDYAGMLRTLGYYVDGDGTVTKAVARITSTPYPTLAAAVGAAADGATVTLLRASSEEITLNKAITLRETANFSGTLTGNGTLTFYAFRNNPDITFENWEGTIVLPEFAANGTILNKYGVTGSTVVLKGITAGWLGETSSQKMDVNPVLQLDGDVTIKGFSTSWDYTFAELTGTGNFVLDPTDNSPKSATITTVAEDFTGIITNNTTVTLTIGTLERADGTTTEVDDKLLDVSGDVVAEALTVDGEPVDVRLETREDGIYVGAPYVAYVGETPYTSLADAVADATDGDTVELVADVELTARVEPNVGAETEITIDLGGFTITPTVTCGNGSAFDVKSGNVTIKNGAINGSAITTIECDPITARSGSDVTLEDLEITICSQSGACAYPFTGAKMTIKSGTYKNTTTIPYQWQQTTGQAKDWTGMAVNQGNVATQLLFIEGGTFSKVNPALGDDSWEAGTGTFLAEGRIAKLQDGYWVVKAGEWRAQIEGGDKYETLAEAVSAATSGDTVKLLTDVTLDARVEPNLGNGTTLTIDLNDFTITPTVTCKNGSAFDVKSGNVTIKNGAINGSAITTIECDPITARSGSDVTLEDLEITICSQNGACAYPFTGAKMTIKSGTYANTTEVPYQWQQTTGQAKDWTGMAVNQGNVATQLLFIEGGTFSKVNPALGDDSWEAGTGTFLAEGYQSTETSTGSGVWVVTEKQGIDPTDPTSTQEVTPSEQEIADAGSAEAAAKAKATVTVPEAVATATGVTEETYKGYFTYTVTETATEGVYEVAIAGLNEEAVFPTSEAEKLTADLADVLDVAAGTDVEIANAKPGLYYSIEAATDVGFTTDKVEGARKLATTGTVSPKKPAKTGTAVFYRVKVSVTPDSVTP